MVFRKLFFKVWSWWTTFVLCCQADHIDPQHSFLGESIFTVEAFTLFGQILEDIMRVVDTRDNFAAGILLVAQYISSDRNVMDGNIPAYQLCQLRNMIKKFFASNKLACLAIIYTQTIASYISSNLMLIWIIGLHTINIIPSFLQSSSEVASCCSDYRFIPCLNP